MIEASVSGRLFKRLASHGERIGQIVGARVVRSHYSTGHRWRSAAMLWPGFGEE